MSEKLPESVVGQVLSLLKNERAALHAFVVLLEKEQQTLLDNDAEALLSLAELKNQSANKLNEIANQRRQLLMMPKEEVSDVAAWMQRYAPQDIASWEEVRQLAAQAYHLNQTNGEVIQLKLRSNQQALTVLLGAAQSTAGLYGRDGQPNLSATTGRTLGSG